jgi:hypothetical protein
MPEKTVDTIIPAEPGYFLIKPDDGEDGYNMTPIVAWRIHLDPQEEKLITIPITVIAEEASGSYILTPEGPVIGSDRNFDSITKWREYCRRVTPKVVELEDGGADVK